MDNNIKLKTVLAFDADREFWNRMRYKLDNFWGGAAPLAKLLQMQYPYKYSAPETFCWRTRRMKRVAKNGVKI